MEGSKDTSQYSIVFTVFKLYVFVAKRNISDINTK